VGGGTRREEGCTHGACRKTGRRFASEHVLHGVERRAFKKRGRLRGVGLLTAAGVAAPQTGGKMGAKDKGETINEGGGANPRAARVGEQSVPGSMATRGENQEGYWSQKERGEKKKKGATTRRTSAKKPFFVLRKNSARGRGGTPQKKKKKQKEKKEKGKGTHKPTKLVQTLR